MTYAPIAHARAARSWRVLVSRAGWNLLDQAISSLSNSALTIIVARAVSANVFGAFALSFTVYQFLIAVTRSLTGQPLAVRYSACTPEQLRASAGYATGFAACLGVTCGTLCVAAGAVVGGDVGGALIAMGIVTPGVLLQDTWRNVFIVAARPSAAVVNDLCWGLLQLLGVVWVAGRGTNASFAYVLVWGASGALAAAFASRQFGGTLPQLRSALRWLRSTWDLSRFFIAAGLALNGANQIALVAAASLGSVTDVGAVRAAQVLLGPVNLIAISLYTFALPEFARRPWLTSRQQLRWGLILSSGLAAVDAAWGLGLLLLPRATGAALLGETWAHARGALPGSIAAAAGIGLTTGPAIILRCHEHVRVAFRISAAQGMGIVVMGLAGVRLDGSAGLAWGLAVASWGVLPVWWWHGWHSARAPMPQPRESPTAVG